MEGKFVVVMMSALLVVVVLGQIHQAEAKIICCPTFGANAIYQGCMIVPFISKAYCVSSAGCNFVDGSTCPDGWYYGNFLPPTATANEFCKSGCVSSVCAAMTTLQVKDHSSSADASPDVVNGAIKKCSNACTAFCANNKASKMTAVEHA